MKSKRIKKQFQKIFNNQPNPIFCHPIMYFQHKLFICELAASKPMCCFKLNIYFNPLNILEGLFYDQGYWITVLQRTSNGYVKTNLNTHFDDWKKELNTFINTKLNTKL